MLCGAVVRLARSRQVGMPRYKIACLNLATSLKIAYPPSAMAAGGHWLTVENRLAFYLPACFSRDQLLQWHYHFVWPGNDTITSRGQVSGLGAAWGQIFRYTRQLLPWRQLSRGHYIVAMARRVRCQTAGLYKIGGWNSNGADSKDDSFSRDKFLETRPQF